MSVLVDTSIWVAYFRSGDNSEKLDFLIDENLIVINDLVLAELVPSLKVRNQRKIINLLYNIIKFLGIFIIFNTITIMYFIELVKNIRLYNI